MICGLFLKGRHIGMKVSIIDNSLCDSSFVSDVKPEAIKAYTDALHEFGVSYIEMTTDSFIDTACKRYVEDNTSYDLGA